MNHKEIERWYRLRYLKKAALYLIVGSLVVMTGAGVAHFFLVEDRPKAPAPIAEKGMGAKRFHYSVPGANPWEIEATAADMDRELNHLRLRGPKVRYKLDDGGVISLSARSGSWNKIDREVTASGDVSITFDQYRLNVDRAKYSEQSRTIQSPESVTVRAPNFELSGTGLTVCVDKKEFRVEHNVRTRLSNFSLTGRDGRLPM